MTVFYEGGGVTVLHGDCVAELAGLPDGSVDAVVTDPPYGLEFMGKEWDGPKQWAKQGENNAGFFNHSGHARMGQALYKTDMHAFQAWCETWAAECLRVLKPGGHLLAFGGTRTAHRLTCAIEDAGFEIRDSIAWLYGSGFPKSLDVSKAIDRAAGAEREVVGTRTLYGRAAQSTQEKGGTYTTGAPSSAGLTKIDELTSPATDDARTWQGWGTALKPAHEPITVARKPLSGTVAATVLQHGTGALNIDGCRIEGDVPSTVQGQAQSAGTIYGADQRTLREFVPSPAGRWPANVVLDETAAAHLDQQSGQTISNDPGTTHVQADGWGHSAERRNIGYAGDTGGASRFFYTAKAGSAERVRNGATAHPTVKSLALMRWLVRLVTPPGGLVLDPFGGSGTTAEAALLEGFACITVEREAEYLPMIVQRLNRRRDPEAYLRAAGVDDLGLFALDDDGNEAR